MTNPNWDAYGCGTVYEPTHIAAGWGYKLLHSLVASMTDFSTSIMRGLAVAAEGRLYGTTVRSKAVGGGRMDGV